MDGIDAALVRLGERSCETLTAHTHHYSDDLRKRLITISRDPGSAGIDDLGRLDRAVGQYFCDAALDLLSKSGKSAADVVAIGSHGQTLRHLPDGDEPFSMQIGDPNMIAQGTGVTTVADFRRRDMAAGGEGAPLTPGFHHWLFADDTTSRTVINLGGIANISVLQAGNPSVTGFDTGPANILMDAWIFEQQGQRFDRDGQWAKTGSVSTELLADMLGDPYFERQPPKSTGFEYFNLDWLRDKLSTTELTPVDVQASLLALTAESVASAISEYAPDTDEVLVCGGGVHNGALLAALCGLLAPMPVRSTSRHGVDPDWVEAAAFAWLARQSLHGQPGNMPSVTGAGTFEVLGGIYLCAS